MHWILCCKTFRSSSSFEPGDEKDWSDRDRDWFERFDCSEWWQGRDGRNSQSGKRSFIKEPQERGGKSRDNRDSADIGRHVTDGRDKGGRDKWGGNRSQLKDPTGEEHQFVKKLFRLPHNEKPHNEKVYLVTIWPNLSPLPSSKI